MNFNDIINEKNIEIILGYNENKQCKINLKQNPSITITGSTGTSKSIMMHEILLQIINNYKDNLQIITISKTKVELKQYAESKYGEGKVIDNKEEAIKKINNVINQNNNKLTVIAIDEATDILQTNEGKIALHNLINKCKTNNTILILNTSDVYNDFFEENINTEASCLISFDFTTKDETKLNNINNSQNLAHREFLIRINNNSSHKYMMPNFDETIIDEILK